MNPLLKNSSTLIRSAKHLAKLTGPLARSRATVASESNGSAEILVPAFRDCSWFRDAVEHWRKNHPYYRTSLYQRLTSFSQEILSQPEVASNQILAEHLDLMIKYNLFEVNMIRGSQIMHMMRLLKGDEKLAQTAGLIPEFIRASFNISDDVIDQGKFRYQKLAWYRLPNVGLLVGNDNTLLTAFLVEMSQKAFSHLPCYKEMMQLIIECNLITAMGQFCDEYNARVAKLAQPVNGSYLDWSKFTPENYKSIVVNKTTFVDGISCQIAFYLSGRHVEKYVKEASVITTKLGILDQMADDFLDAFFDADTMNSDQVNVDCGDDDIRVGKLAYPILKALEKAKGEDRKVLESHYGKGDDESVRIVKELYKKLGVFEAYSKEQDEMCKEILNLIEKWDEKNSGVPKEVFPVICTSIYHNGANLSNT